MQDWMISIISGVVGAFGMLGAAKIKAWSTNETSEAYDRAEFTAQILNRLEHVENLVIKEREDCDRKIANIDKHYKSRLEARDIIIIELRNEVGSLRKLVEAHYNDTAE